MSTKFQSLAKTLAPYTEAGRVSVREFVLAAGGKAGKGREYSTEQRERIKEIASEVGVAERTVERWATKKGTEVRDVAPRYRDQLKEILVGERKFKPLTFRFKGTVKISEDTSYRDGGKNSPGVQVEMSEEEVEQLVTAFDDEGEEEAERVFLENYGSGGYFTHPKKGDPVFRVE
jgi:hypothetical protein